MGQDEKPKKISHIVAYFKGARDNFDTLNYEINELKDTITIFANTKLKPKQVKPVLRIVKWLNKKLWKIVKENGYGTN